MFTRDRANRTIGNSMVSPNARNSVVTKSKYGPAASELTRVVARETEQELHGVGQDHVGDRTAQGEEEQRHREPRSDDPALLLGEPRRDERPELVEDHRHRQDDPDDDRDLHRDEERVAGSEDDHLAAGRHDQDLDDLRCGEVPEDRPDRDRQDDPEQPRAELAEVVDEAHHRFAAGWRRGRRGRGIGRRWREHGGGRSGSGGQRRGRLGRGVGGSVVRRIIGHEGRPPGPAVAG